MREVRVELGAQSYPVRIGSGLLKRFADSELHPEGFQADQILIVTNTTVAPLYLAALEASISGLTAHWDSLILADGEHHKTLDSWQQIIDKLVSMRATRSSMIIALGGGVIGDMAGFAAASYMRGIQVLQMPTTLLAMVDAAIGGKTGVNLPAGKNLVGAFHQPCQVVMDSETLTTLPDREFRAGIAEVIKYAMIMDVEFFTWLQQHRQAISARERQVLTDMIYRCAMHKASVVGADALETGQRALLNFGHTFGHALETLTDYRYWLHGEAVAIGMWIACVCGERLQLTKTGTVEQLQELLLAFGFDLSIPESISPDALIESMRLDKKNQHSRITLILLNRIGDAFIKGGFETTDIQPNLPDFHDNYDIRQSNN